MPHLAPRPWVPEGCEHYIQMQAAAVAAFVESNAQICDQDCFNLKLATIAPRTRAMRARFQGLHSMRGV